MALLSTGTQKILAILGVGVSLGAVSYGLRDYVGEGNLLYESSEAGWINLLEGNDYWEYYLKSGDKKVCKRVLSGKKKVIKNDCDTPWLKDIIEKNQDKDGWWIKRNKWSIDSMIKKEYENLSKKYSIEKNESENIWIWGGGEKTKVCTTKSSTENKSEIEVNCLLESLKTKK